MKSVPFPADPDDRMSALYREFWPDLVRLSYRDTRDWDLAEEVARETMIRAARALPKLNQWKRRQAWLFTIRHRALIDICKTLRKKPGFSSLDDNIAVTQHTE